MVAGGGGYSGIPGVSHFLVVSESEAGTLTFIRYPRSRLTLLPATFVLANHELFTRLSQRLSEQA